MRILIVEDEGSIRSALARGLGKRGHKVDAAGTMAEARETIARHHPEALVSDLKLPDGNGLDLAKELQVPFVLMTGYGTFDDAIRAIHLGCVDFFTKPVPIKDICRAIDLIAGRRNHGGPLVIDGADALRLATPDGTNIAVNDLRSGAFAWAGADEARERFAHLGPLAPAVRHRQVAAELMQSAPSGRLVVNLAPGAWSAWLQAGVDWPAHEDRRQLVEDLCHRCAWSADGALVECGND
jgi:DNA-binding response OmpR family regulator